MHRQVLLLYIVKNELNGGGGEKKPVYIILKDTQFLIVLSFFLCFAWMIGLR